MAGGQQGLHCPVYFLVPGRDPEQALRGMLGVLADVEKCLELILETAAEIEGGVRRRPDSLHPLAERGFFPGKSRFMVNFMVK